jgi:hypothetical protein
MMRPGDAKGINMTKKTNKKMWLVDFGMLDRQRANVVVVTNGDEQPTGEQLRDAYEVIDDCWELDPDFVPDEGTHYVVGKVDKINLETHPSVDLTGEYAKYAPPNNRKGLPGKETWYVWREYVTIAGEKKPRLLTPWSDPMIYEFKFDFLYPSVKEAIAGLKEFRDDEDPEVQAEMDKWVLVKMTMEPIPRPKPTKKTKK